MNTLSVDVSHAPGAMIVRLAGSNANGGDADAATLRGHLLEVCKQTPKVLVLDLSGLTDVNSAVLGALLLCRKLMSASGGTLRLAGVRPGVVEVLQRSALLALFDCRGDVRAALVPVSEGDVPAK
jgi:anti-anti-sigma factor